MLVQTDNEKYRTGMPEVKCECVSVWCVGTCVFACVCVCARERWEIPYRHAGDTECKFAPRIGTLEAPAKPKNK